MRILVTGAAGFIGSHIADAALAAGHDVRGLDSLAPAVHDGRPGYWPDAAELVTADVRDPGAVRRALAGVDAVCHEAALVGLGVDLSDLPPYCDVNVTGTAVLLEAMGALGVPRLVLASSMVAYGEGRYDCPEHGPVRPPARARADLERGRFEPRCAACGADLRTATVPESAPLDPRNTYAVSKVTQEQLAGVWAAMTGGAAIALRYHNVYGPRMPRDTPYSGVAAIFRSALEAGRPPRVFEDGGQLRDFVHVTDVAAANLAALAALDAATAPGAAAGTAAAGTSAGLLRAYNVASGQPCTIGEMASALAGAFGGPAPEVTGQFRVGDVRHVVASPELAGSELGFHASISFRQGMAQFAHAPLRNPARRPQLAPLTPAG
ncbi:MAG TPA: NAD-dependent epimerase/dehydratase family protein [Streptosporangiaceae bacterium]|nr:NAD-dependent epimerase/dehydratase family protein [Streptosporangiaceae bacterium]